MEKSTSFGACRSQRLHCQAAKAAKSFVVSAAPKIKTPAGALGGLAVHSPSRTRTSTPKALPVVSCCVTINQDRDRERGFTALRTEVRGWLSDKASKPLFLL